MSDVLRYDGRVCLVTGAGRGIGRAVAALLAARGATVVVNDTGGDPTGSGVDPTIADAAAEEIRRAGGVAVADHTDVGDADAVQALVERIVDTQGRLDVVVANAGISWHRPFADLDDDELATSVRVNLLGPARLCRAAWPELTARPGRRIVLTSSASVFGFGGRTHYVMAKAGLLGLGRSLAVEGRGAGLGVNVVLPWALTRLSADRDDAFGRWVRTHFRPEGVAGAVAWLGHESCDVSGEAFTAEGGRMARVALVTSRGWTDPEGSPESYRDHFTEVMALEPAIVPDGTLDYVRRAVGPSFPPVGD